MVAQREPLRMTVDEWRELERNSHDIKHEYIDGSEISDDSEGEV